MKYVANLLVTIHNVASAEAIVLGMKSGLDPQMVYDLISAGVGKSRVFEVRGPMMVKNDYKNVSMSVKLYHKDISVIGDHAHQAWRADAAVRCQSSDLCLGDVVGLRRARHRLGLRRARNHGRREARQAATARPSALIPVPGDLVRAICDQARD